MTAKEGAKKTAPAAAISVSPIAMWLGAKYGIPPELLGPALLGVYGIIKDLID